MEKFCPTQEQQDELLEEIIDNEIDIIHSEFTSKTLPPKLFAGRPPGQPFTRADYDAAIRRVFSEVIRERIDYYNIWKDDDPISFTDALRIVRVSRKVWEPAYDAYFGPYKLTAKEKREAQNLFAWVVKTSKTTENTTGIVFAGFGSNELFPSLIAIEISGVIGGLLKTVEVNRIDIDRKDVTGAVIPFAQKDTADSLLYGCSQNFELEILGHFENAIEEFGKGLAKEAFADETLRQQYIDRMMTAKEAAIDRYIAEVSPKIRNEFFDDVLDNIRHMPKQEIASFAEALVNVTSIKRKVSPGPETVGGPIDVAVISRHEGFVWVKRKHYFPAEINQRYQWRTYGQGREGSYAERRNGEARPATAREEPAKSALTETGGVIAVDDGAGK